MNSDSVRAYLTSSLPQVPSASSSSLPLVSMGVRVQRLFDSLHASGVDSVHDVSGEPSIFALPSVQTFLSRHGINPSVGMRSSFLTFAIQTCLDQKVDVANISYEDFLAKALPHARTLVSQKLQEAFTRLGFKMPAEEAGAGLDFDSFITALAIRNTYASIPEEKLQQCPELRAVAEEYERIASPLRKSWMGAHLTWQKIKKSTKRGLEQILLVEKKTELGAGAFKVGHKVILYKATRRKEKVLALMKPARASVEQLRQAVIRDMVKEHCISRLLRERGACHILYTRRVDVLNQDGSVAEVGLLSDLCDRGTLNAQRIPLMSHKESRLTIEERFGFALEIAQAIDDVHQKGGFGHGDLFTRNIFLRTDFEGKAHAFLGDFGNAVLPGGASREEIERNQAIDLLCLGNILYQLLHPSNEALFSRTKTPVVDAWLDGRGLPFTPFPQPPSPPTLSYLSFRPQEASAALEEVVQQIFASNPKVPHISVHEVAESLLEIVTCCSQEIEEACQEEETMDEPKRKK